MVNKIHECELYQLIFPPLNPLLFEEPAHLQQQAGKSGRTIYLSFFSEMTSSSPVAPNSLTRFLSTGYNLKNSRSRETFLRTNWEKEILFLPSLIKINEEDCVIPEARYSVSSRHSNNEGKNVVDESVESLCETNSRYQVET
jgi:hypothetical protein